MSGSPRLLRFAVPPSLGALRATTAANQLGSLLRRLLAPELSVEMHVAESYESLYAAVAEGRADAAWAPPLLCARLELAGGRAVARVVRGGAETYRTAFVCRSEKPVELAPPSQLRVAWVDRQSLGGYLVPRAWLLESGLAPAAAFREELFAGSYYEALVALVAGKVDLTVTYAASAAASFPSSGLDQLPEGLKAAVKVIGHTADMPNDGVVAAPGIPDETFRHLQARLATAHADEAGLAALTAAFGGERLAVASGHGYGALSAFIPR